MLIYGNAQWWITILQRSLDWCVLCIVLAMARHSNFTFWQTYLNRTYVILISLLFIETSEYENRNQISLQRTSCKHCHLHSKPLGNWKKKRKRKPLSHLAWKILPYVHFVGTFCQTICFVVNFWKTSKWKNRKASCPMRKANPIWWKRRMEKSAKRNGFRE